MQNQGAYWSRPVPLPLLPAVRPESPICKIMPSAFASANWCRWIRLQNLHNFRTNQFGFSLELYARKFQRESFYVQIFQNIEDRWNISRPPRSYWKIKVKVSSVSNLSIIWSYWTTKRSITETALFIDFVSSLFCMTQLGHWIDGNLQYDYLRSIILRIVFFRHCPNYLPSLPPIRATFTKIFPRWNSRFESQFWTKNT